MDYRITKIKTKDKQFGMPVSVSLDEAVKRMASDKHAQAVEDIAHDVTRSLILKKEKGWESPGVKGIDDLPCLIFSATFGRQGLQDYRQPTGLVLLSADYGVDLHRMQVIRDSAVQLPQTVLVFRSVSRRSLKIIVRCRPKEGELPQTAESYEQFLSDAQQQAAKYYSAFCDCQIRLEEESLHRGCRMSQDSQLYYNPDA